MAKAQTGQRKSPQRIEAERLCAEFPDVPSRTLAKRLSTSHKITLEQARGIIRLARGNHGVKNRSQATHKRPPQPAGWKPSLPPSLAEPWTPFDLGNDVRAGIISDLHVPYHSVMACESPVKELKRRKIDTLILNGDGADFYSISRHQKNPAKRDLVQEIDSMRECLGWLRHEFPKVRFIYKLGNHEERWQHWLWNAMPELSHHGRMDVKEWLDCEKYGIEVVGDQRPLMLGHLPVFHGHELPRGISSPVNPARGAFMRTHSTILVAHSHVTSQHGESNLWHVPTATWSQGCCCDLTPEYARINKWNHGFAFVEVDKAGEFSVENMRVGVAGQIYR